MPVRLNLERILGDTKPHTIRFFTDEARTAAMSLSGLTFDAHVETTTDTTVLTFSTITPSGTGSNVLTLTPDSPGSWADLELGRYRVRIRDVTGGTFGTFAVGELAVNGS